MPSRSPVRRNSLRPLSLLMTLGLLPAVNADDLAFSDPALGLPAPAWAVGQANRTPQLDVAPGFKQPPAGFGMVPFFWWQGDPLTQDRLGWILGQMEGYCISGYQINYAHSKGTGGRSFGLSMPSEPALLTPEWWKLTAGFLQTAKKQGAAISLSDYTLGIGQGWTVDRILKDHPEMTGATLKLVKGKAADALTSQQITQADGQKQDISVVVEKKPWSLNPMHPQSGETYARNFFGQFEDRFPGEGGKGLNFFFSDELEFGLKSNLLWDERFASEFTKRKGYDIVPELAALFEDIGARTPKIRLDYSDVMVALSEEGFFKPVYNWHQERGMTMGCDHGGRGRDVTEFGDYFRTQRWNQGPGSDQPNLGKGMIKAKVASSMAHLYQRPRVWLEGFYGSGWGTTSAGVADATFANFVMGYNLLSFHGMYYSTHGGWWEWAPPDNTFRMPYWKHMKGFMECVQRLSYLLTQGTHACDVAVIYPVAPMEAGMNGKEAVATAFESAQKLYDRSIDFDFMDFQSLERATIVDGKLVVSGEAYKILVLPSMKAVRHSMLKKALEFKQAGGVVLAVGALPEASERVGRNDPELAALVAALFPEGPTPDLVKTVTEKLPVLDYAGPGYVQHRKVGPRDLYAIYNAPKDAAVTFRAVGKVELWDPWTGTARPLPVTAQADGQTQLKLPLSATEVQLVVFSPGVAEIAPAAPQVIAPQILPIEGDWAFELQPTSDNRYGDFHWPPTPTLIGAEARQVWYCEGASPAGPWRKTSAAFGPQFLKCAELPDLTSLTPPKTGTRWEFSWRWGIETNPGEQGYHGLKEIVNDNTLTIGKRQEKGWDTRYEPEAQDSFYWTTVVAPQAMSARLHTGLIKPLKAWLNGSEISGDTVQLKAGTNPLVLQYARTKTGGTYLVVSTSTPIPPTLPPARLPDGQQPTFKLSELRSKWTADTGILPFDIRPEEPTPLGWYRFVAPPGLRALTVKALGEVQVSIDNQALTSTRPGVFTLPAPHAEPATVLIRIAQKRGTYGGAALLEPITLDCGAGRLPLGDWALNEGLASYSGGAWYRKTIQLPAGKSVQLDLGDVRSSAEVRVNGKTVGVRITPPWTFDISGYTQVGENRIEVLVYNTLANHYSSVPTSYRGSPVSGMLGPVQVRISP